MFTPGLHGDNVCDSTCKNLASSTRTNKRNRPGSGLLARNADSGSFVGCDHPLHQREQAGGAAQHCVQPPDHPGQEYHGTAATVANDQEPAATAHRSAPLRGVAAVDPACCLPAQATRSSRSGALHTGALVLGAPSPSSDLKFRDGAGAEGSALLRDPSSDEQDQMAAQQHVRSADAQCSTASMVKLTPVEELQEGSSAGGATAMADVPALRSVPGAVMPETSCKTRGLCLLQQETHSPTLTASSRPPASPASAVQPNDNNGGKSNLMGQRARKQILLAGLATEMLVLSPSRSKPTSASTVSMERCVGSVGGVSRPTSGSIPSKSRHVASGRHQNSPLGQGRDFHSGVVCNSDAVRSSSHRLSFSGSLRI
jgi:hypothetical protein